MIDRYKNPDISRIFSDEAKFARWSLLESAAYVTLERGCNHTKAKLIKDFIPDSVGFTAVEATTRHDVQTFLILLERHLTANNCRMDGVHSRMTSSDLVDTGLAMALGDCTRTVRSAMVELSHAYLTMKEAQKDTILDGRTHGRIALPTTGSERWGRMMMDLAVWDGTLTTEFKGKFGGPVGSSFSIAELEAFVRVIKVQVETGLGRQCASRHNLASYMHRFVSLAGILEAHATNLRLWMIEGVDEYKIARHEGYVGSSSMPFKNNPTDLERVCGMARLVRGYGLALNESCSLWHERDISHSSVERIAIEDIFHCILMQFKDLTETVKCLHGVSYEPKSPAKVALVSEANRKIQSGASREQVWSKTEKS